METKVRITKVLLPQALDLVQQEEVTTMYFVLLSVMVIRNFECWDATGWLGVSMETRLIS